MRPTDAIGAVQLQSAQSPGISEALERNQWEFIRGFAAVSGVEVVEDAHTLRVATGVPSPLFNPVLRIDVERERIDDAIEEAREWYRARRLPWSWYVGPASRPASFTRELRTPDIAVR